MEISDETRDVSNSVAVALLDNLLLDGQISRAQCDLYRSKYAKLHELVIVTYENERNFLRRAKELNHQLVSEKIRLEHTTVEQSEDAAKIAALKANVKRLGAEYDAGCEREAMQQMQLSELDHEKRDLSERLQEREQLESAQAEPVIQRTQQEVDLLQRELDHAKATKEKHQSRIAEATQKVERLEEELETNRIIVENHERELKKIAGDPERLRKQGEKFASAVRSLEGQCGVVASEVKDCEDRLEALGQKKKDAEERRSKGELRLAYIKESVKVTTQGAGDVKKKLMREQALQQDSSTKRVSLDLDAKMVNEEIRTSVDKLTQEQKGLDRLKRTYKKKEMHRDSIVESMPPLHNDKTELAKTKKQLEDDLRRQKKLLEEIQAEVDVFIGAFLKQETLSKEKKEQFEQIAREMDTMNKELTVLKKQEQVMLKEFAFLCAEREKMAREASRAQRLFRETDVEVQMKELEDCDMKKKLAELMQRQKEYSAAYETVKNERNNLVARIQSSSQELSEKKEKLKILQNEMEILKMESAAKDRALATARAKAQKHRAQRDQLRSDYTRVASQGAALNDKVEQYVMEMDKLNAIINRTEKEMVVLKRSYEKGVEARNFTGIQLIDRNDELCILWEKSNIQEKMLKKGGDAMLSKDEEVRILRIALCEVQRKLQVLQKRIPDVHKLGMEVQRLRSLLAEERKTSGTLGAELENPQSTMRKWQHLPGTDPDQETLQAKIQFLEERLNDKKESLLEKELVLEEVTTLSEKLRAQAMEGRAGTLELSQKVNAFQARIKDVTRKMMATVSELSMYQATSIKLEGEAEELQGELERQQLSLADGNPPYEGADIDAEHQFRLQRLRKEQHDAVKLAKNEEDVFLSQAVRTTAEPRVNAYVPQNDDLGLPRAYGAHAPFMPTAIGSNARHIRKPQPRTIDI